MVISRAACNEDEIGKSIGYTGAAIVSAAFDTANSGRRDDRNAGPEDNTNISLDRPRSGVNTGVDGGN